MRRSRTYAQHSMDNLKVLREYYLSFVKNTADYREHGLPSGCDLPAMSTRSSKSQHLSFCGEPNHSFDDGWIVDWNLHPFYYVFESLDNLRYSSRLNCAKKGTEVFQTESQREPQVSSIDVDNNKVKGIEDPDQPLTSLLKEKGLEIETCDGEGCTDQDPASDISMNLGYWHGFKGLLTR